MTLSELCIRRPVLTTLITVSFLVFGAFAYRLLPVSALPRGDFPTISIKISAWGSATATDGTLLRTFTITKPNPWDYTMRG